MKFDRNTCKQINDEAMEALQAVAEKQGLVVQRSGSGSFSSTNFSFKVEFATVQDGIVQDRESQAFTALSRVYGFEPTDLGKTFVYNNVSYAITGLKPNCKNAVICRNNVNNREYRFSADVVKAFLKVAV